MASTLDADAISGMSPQELYDLGPDTVAGLPAAAWEIREATLAEYFRDVAAGYEPPLREPDAYSPGSFTGLPVDDLEQLVHLQATEGRAAVLKALRRMRDRDWRPIPVILPDVYPLGQPADSYGPTVMVWND